MEIVNELIELEKAVGGFCRNSQEVQAELHELKEKRKAITEGFKKEEEEKERLKKRKDKLIAEIKKENENIKNVYIPQSASKKRFVLVRAPSELKPKQLTEVGDGILALTPIPAGEIIGEYKGKSVDSYEDIANYKDTLSIEKEGEKKYIDATYSTEKNWPRYINDYRTDLFDSNVNKENQNVAFTEDARIKTVKDIQPWDELLAAYREEYWTPDRRRLSSIIRRGDDKSEEWVFEILFSEENRSGRNWDIFKVDSRRRGFEILFTYFKEEMGVEDQLLEYLKIQFDSPEFYRCLSKMGLSFKVFRAGPDRLSCIDDMRGRADEQLTEDYIINRLEISEAVPIK